MKHVSPVYTAWLQSILPAQVTGHSTVTYSQCRVGSRIVAEQYFTIAARRLLEVNHWQRWAGKATAVFQLVDAKGQEQNRAAKKGDYLRIDIPAPANPDGKGDDWVQVEDVGERSTAHHRLTFLTVRAALSPLKQVDNAAHFFERKATSTFLVYLENDTLIAAVYGRNERPNFNSGNLITRLRNWLVYLGARLGLSALQWKSLTKGLLQFSA
ncbi:hypothetical protein [Paraflavitalea sp. CAU 1676]|uniref:hypothetical protein n=1 Tax=Paraflavitalea sp. CAU 1676 TaxID=3032598 RepID=UPI0023D9C504|nr:hypothetical protein [Paraflavitalea sp. CAU 1676]MDF2191284.1 hypothetical protein [Paraflavitalea sp. CAU 1676]